MILKASQRGGGKALAVHLMRTDENEHVEVHEIRGFVSSDVRGAFKEAHAISQGTRCRQYLFSVSLNPPQGEDVRIEVFEEALAKIENKNGLAGQPRVVVFHEKEGRRHCHAVWSRIDTETMTAKQLSHFKMKMRDVSREIFLEQGWKLPKGLMNSKEADPRNFTLDEWQKSKRSGQDPRDIKEAIQECWAASDSRHAFERALESRGLYLARGDRRGFVALTHDGEAFAIPRVTGRKTNEISARLGDPDKLRSVEETKAHIANLVAPRIEKLVADAEREKGAAMRPLNQSRLFMRDAHAREREQLLAAQQEREQKEVRERAERLRTGIRGLWDRLTGERARTVRQNETEALAALKRDADQRETLRKSHLSDRRQLQTEIVAVRNSHKEKVHGLHAELHQLREPQVKRSAMLKDSFQYAAHQGAPVLSSQTVKTHATRLEELRRSAERTPSPVRNRSARGHDIER